MNEQIGLPSDGGARDIVLADGDVRTIRVLHAEGETHLLIFDEDGAVLPLVCAVLSAEERTELRRALANRG